MWEFDTIKKLIEYSSLALWANLVYVKMTGVSEMIPQKLNSISMKRMENNIHKDCISISSVGKWKSTKKFTQDVEEKIVNLKLVFHIFREMIDIQKITFCKFSNWSH